MRACVRAGETMSQPQIPSHSMSQLQSQRYLRPSPPFYLAVSVAEVMPADTSTDFDAHLQHSIMSLQQLNSAMAKDVAILYSAWDVPANSETDKVHPAWLKDDLEKDGEKEGYSW